MKQRWQINKGSIWWWCPGCDELHRVPINGSDPAKHWTLVVEDGVPSITPSVLIYGWKSPDPIYKSQPRCHGFLTRGRYQFCSDSEHALAGQTVDLPEFDL